MRRECQVGRGSVRARGAGARRGAHGEGARRKRAAQARGARGEARARWVSVASEESSTSTPSPQTKQVGLRSYLKVGAYRAWPPMYMRLLLR